MSTAAAAVMPIEQTEVTPRVSLGLRTAVLLSVALPFLGFLAGIVTFWGHGVSWLQLGLMLGMYLVTAVGVTAGFHRLFTHRSFETIRPIKLLLGVMGSMAVQGPLIKWVAVHRRHHHHSDTEGDPHSPHLHGSGLPAMLRGIWHAHTGWLFAPDAPDLYRYVADLMADRSTRAISALFPLWVALGLAIPAALGGWLTGTWWGALLGFLWGGLARVFLVHHVTWSINSVCHIWGSRPFRSRDQSRNNVLFGLLGLGEGWHNNHHAFPTSARHGLRWWEFDVTYLLIRAMEAVRLAWKVRVPTAHAIAARLR